MSKPFSHESAKIIERAFRANHDLTCPECEVALDRRAIPPRKDVSYVRDRLWLVCPACSSTVVLDRRDGR